MIKVKLLHDDAIVPEMAYPTDSGYDLFTVENLVLYPKQKGIAKTGIAVSFPEGLSATVRPRSGNTVKGVPCLKLDPMVEAKEECRADVTVYLGTIDNAYTGEIGIMVKNEEDCMIIIPAGTKLAQLVLERVPHEEFIEVDELDETARADGGFGSTGSSL